MCFSNNKMCDSNVTNACLCKCKLIVMPIVNLPHHFHQITNMIFTVYKEIENKHVIVIFCDWNWLKHRLLNALFHWTKIHWRNWFDRILFDFFTFFFIVYRRFIWQPQFHKILKAAISIRLSICPPETHYAIVAWLWAKKIIKVKHFYSSLISSNFLFVQSIQRN